VAPTEKAAPPADRDLKFFDAMPGLDGEGFEVLAVPGEL
jgi:hypothetical protein